jgi:NMD protein affecting ribosome stability and mRNA decay
VREEVRKSEPKASVHEHTAMKKRALGQRAGIPYEVVQTVCSQCLRVLDERPVRRAAA